MQEDTGTAIILIGADICPIEANRPYFERGDAESLFHDLLPELARADLRIANLECPLIERETPILKTGPVFGESIDCINGIRAAGFDVLTLANNHVRDHGSQGLETTLKACARAGISTVGAGENLAAARRICLKEVRGIKVGILAVAEHEFSIASKDSWGANPLDLIDYVRNVKRHRDSWDYLIVLLHGGDEFFVPSPRVKDTCRFMIEMGANAVIVQHPHVLGGYEEYHGGHIVYGQGALIMDEAIYRTRKSFHEGFLVQLSVSRGGGSAIDFLPFVQSDPPPGARKMGGEAEHRFRRLFEDKVNALKDDAYIEAQWLKFCEERKHGYLGSLLGHNRILARMNRHGALGRFVYGKKILLGTRNIVCCETHREAVETIFNHQLIRMSIR